MTPIQAGNSDSQKQLQQWLEEADVAELNAEEQRAIAQLMAELQDIPSPSISPRLDGRLQSLSQWQPAPKNPLKRFLALVSAGLATASAVLLWQSSGLRLQVAKKRSEPAVAVAKAERTPRPAPLEATPSNREFLLTSGNNPDARATVTIRPERATNLLVSQGLPQLPVGQTYRLWAETPLGLQGCMTFRTDAGGNATIQVPREPSGSAISLLISIDPVYTGSSAERPGRPVLTSL